MTFAGSLVISPLLQARQVTPADWIIIALVVLVTWALATPAVVGFGGWDALQAEWALGKWGIVFAGVVTLAGYSVVLWVVRSGTAAQYVGAVREVSVVLAALVGVVGLREGSAVPRLIGAAVVAAGVALIASAA